MDEKHYIKATWRIMERLLEAETLEDGLSGSLEVIVDELNSEAGAIWLLDAKTNMLSPIFNVCSDDISNIIVENGQGIEGVVTQSGKSIMIEDTSDDPRFEGSVFDDIGLTAKSMICVPLNNMHNVIGCVQIINKKDGSSFGKDELTLCERMAALAAMTIEEKGLLIDLGEKREVLAELKDVTKDYPSGDGVLHVLNGINLEIFKNEFIVVLGESGCGKSTLMNIIGGMDSLTGGKLIIEGNDFSAPSDAELTRYRRVYVGFIFQDYHLMPNLTALENVEYVAELVEEPMDPSEAIKKVCLSERADYYPGQMSGGQQQRVSIARAIVKRPKLILADEPTAALDYATSIEVLSVIEDIVRNQGTTVMMITHNAEIAKMADRVVKLRNGRVALIKKNMRPLRAEELVW